MSLNRGIVNPLGVLKMRRLTFIPKHFTKIKTSESIDIRILDQWINYNLNSRYAIKKTFTLDQNNKMIEAIEIGIEDPKEIIMLTLGCPCLHKN
jgi:hypothetical protein